MTTVEAVRHLIEDDLQTAAEELRQALSRLGASITLGSGAWSNDAGIVTGYLSVFPHGNPAEQSIDATISFSLSEGKAKLSADICWSDGTPIVDILEDEIVFSDRSELLQNAKRFCQAALAEFVRKLPDVIAKQKDAPPKL